MSQKEDGQSRRDFLKFAAVAAPGAAALAATGQQAEAATPQDPGKARIQDTAHTRAYFDSARF